MSVNVSPSRVAAARTLPPSIRAEGRLSLVTRRSVSRSAIGRVAEAGPLRVRFPRITDKNRLEAILINTAGGIVGGDVLQYEIESGERTTLALTSQAAEKIYRSAGETARIKVKLMAHDGSTLAWLPQETILFDRVKVGRSLEADIAPSANVTICESVVFGRTAMGERVAMGAFEDCWRIKRGGRLVFADTTRLDGKIDSLLGKAAIANGATCIATILHVAPDADTRCEAARAALDDPEIEAGASAFEGMLIVRMLAADSFALRRAIVNLLHAIGSSPPRAFTL
jgi:urease accessory protein